MALDWCGVRVDGVSVQCLEIRGTDTSDFFPNRQRRRDILWEDKSEVRIDTSRVIIPQVCRHSINNPTEVGVMK